MNENETTESPKQDSEENQIPWHAAFIEAIQMELADYKDDLEFIPELQLTAEPLKIDCVIIKKKNDVVIKKNIARIFRKWNIIEYKSPDDYVSIKDFYKVYGYACLYTFLGDTTIDNLTITFIESHHPKKLLTHLEKVRGYTVEKPQKGVYNIKGDILPIQILDSRYLPEEDNLWLTSLRNRLNRSQIKRVLNIAGKFGKAVNLAAYLYVIGKANYKVLQEVTGMIDYTRAPPEITKIFTENGWIARWNAEEREKYQIVLADKEAELADREAVLADQKAVIEQLNAQIAELQAKMHNK